MAVTLAAPACSQTPEQAAVSHALEATLDALQAADWQAVWDLSAPEAQAQLLALHGRLHEGLAAVPRIYPEDQRSVAMAALGHSLVGDIAPDAADAGPRLLARLLVPDAARLDETARDGLLGTAATIDGDRAVLHTTAGEAFTFRKAGDAWRSRLVVDIMTNSGRITTLEESATAVLKAAKLHQDAWTASRDPKTPNGAFNLARAALEREPRDADVLFALLDKGARARLAEAMEAGRAAQKAIQRKTSRKQRDEAYATHGITLHVAADSDRALFGAWVASDTYEPPFKGDPLPARVQGDATAEQVIVVTADDQRVSFARNDQGYWLLSAESERLTRALVAPPRAALASLTSPPTDTR